MANTPSVDHTLALGAGQWVSSAASFSDLRTIKLHEVLDIWLLLMLLLWIEPKLGNKIAAGLRPTASG